MLPLVAKYGAAVVAITNDETGISEDPDVRFTIAEKIVHAAADHGIPAHDVVVDPLVMPIGAMRTAGRQVFRLVRRLQDELGVNTTCGASNVSFGLPNRNGINGAFLAMAIACGMTSAITSPLHDEVKQATMAADVLMGTDAHAEAWIRPVLGSRGRRRPRGSAAAGAAAAQRASARRRNSERGRDHTSSSHRRDARRGRRRGERARCRPCAWASTSTRSAAAAASAVAARWCRWRARSPSTGSQRETTI